MAIHSVTGFWIGNHGFTPFAAGTVYGPSDVVAFTISDDDGDGISTGSANGDGNETVTFLPPTPTGMDTSSFVIVESSMISLTFTDPSGIQHTEDIAYVIKGDFFTEMIIPGPSSAFVTGSTIVSFNGSPINQFNYADVTCFTTGTLIQTTDGPVRVEDLKARDRIITAGGGSKALRKVMNRKVDSDLLRDNPKLLPVRITAGSLGHGFPKRDLLVSRQHRMLVSSKIVQRMFGVPEVLVAAIRLTDLPGIYVETDVTEVTYFHLLFDNHEVIYAEGAATESFYLGAQALKTVSFGMRAEIMTLFPQLSNVDETWPATRPIPPGCKQRELIMRHKKHAEPVREWAKLGGHAGNFW